jgi:hypothetical protein
VQNGSFALSYHLYLAIVNRGILDVLEKGQGSAAARQRLLGRDFHRLQELFGKADTCNNAGLRVGPAEQSRYVLRPASEGSGSEGLSRTMHFSFQIEEDLSW